MVRVKCGLTSFDRETFKKKNKTGSKGMKD